MTNTERAADVFLKALEEVDPKFKLALESIFRKEAADKYALELVAASKRRRELNGN